MKKALGIAIIITALVAGGIYYITQQPSQEEIDPSQAPIAASFSCGELFFDERDGKSYETVKIGNKCWFAENLDYDDGCSERDWAGGREYMGWCGYHESDTAQEYGLLYQYQSSSRGRSLCPEGWQIPSDEEFIELEIFLGMPEEEVEKEGRWRGTNEGGMLKKTGTEHWNWEECGEGDCNAVGFSAQGGGLRDFDRDFDFWRSGGYWWTSTRESPTSQYWYRHLRSGSSEIFRGVSWSSYAYSIRCLKVLD